MKKLLIAIAILAVLAVSAFAEKYTEFEYNASGDTSAEVTLDDQATGRRYVIYNIYADSDLSSSVLAIQKADAAGVTTSYTTVFTLPQTDTSAYTFNYSNNGEPIFIGDPNYRYKVTCSSTTANSLMVTYERK